MKTLHIFYPENDLALADNTANYTAPCAAVDMRVSGEPLPLWFADNGDVVYTSGVNDIWYNTIRDFFDIKADLWQGQPVDTVRPWGWSPAVKRYLERLGVGDDVLPTAAQIARIRELSHRSLAACLSDFLRENMGEVVASSALEVSDIEEVHRFVDRNGRTLVKLPWSGSGRGIIDSALVPDPEFSRRTLGSIHRQGSVMLERYHDLHYDFALLFNMHGGNAEFTGYSLFFTDNRGMYVGNLVAEERILSDELSQHFDMAILEKVITLSKAFLNAEIGADYEGPLGIDMMAIDNGKRLAVGEINLRNTMGHVAHALARRYLAPGYTAHFTVLPNDGSPVHIPHPHNICDGQLTAGTLDLTPADRRFRFLLEM